MGENAITVQEKNLSDVVLSKVRTYQNSGSIYLPSDYSPENALKSAWLILQETEDKDKQPVLLSCTGESVANSLFSMIVQGLDPNKNQCYFIAYGKKLTLQRSYFGSMAVAKRVDENIEDIFAEVVYEGDVFKYKKHRGRTIIVEHQQELQNINKSKIIAAYCTILYKDGAEKSEIMTLDQIKQAWKQSKMYPVDDKGQIKAGTVHSKFTEEMCKKTVINRTCKCIINSSNDSSLLSRMAMKTESDIARVETQAEISDNANSEIIDLDESSFEEVTEESTPAEDSSNDIPAQEGSQISLDQPPY